MHGAHPLADIGSAVVSALVRPAVALQDAFGGAQISFLVMSAMAGEDRVERRLAAIFAADIAGYSRLMNIDELGTVQTLTAYLACPLNGRYRGESRHGVECLFR